MTDDQRINAALAFIPADDRPTWIRVGMALWSELGPSGFDAFDAWSRTSDRYNKRSTADVWRSFRGVHSVTVASLFSEAQKHGYKHSGSSAPRPIIPRVSTPVDDRKPWDAALQTQWDASIELEGTLGATYLIDARNCALPPSDGDCRFMPAAWHWLDRKRYPALVSRVTDAVTGRPLTLHYTYLQSDGSGKADTDRAKMLAGGYRKSGGVIRLYADSDVETRLTIAEGIETALVAAHARPPVWACVDAGNLAAFPLLSGIESLLIVADHDPKGSAAARDCGARWRDAGRGVTVYQPQEAGRDLADEVGRAAA